MSSGRENMNTTHSLSYMVLTKKIKYKFHSYNIYFTYASGSVTNCWASLSGVPYLSPFGSSVSINFTLSSGTPAVYSLASSTLNMNFNASWPAGWVTVPEINIEVVQSS